MTKYLIIAIGILTLSVFLLGKRLLTVVEHNKQLTEYTLNSSKEIEYHKNKSGEEFAKRQSVELDLSVLKKISSDKELAWIKEFDGVKRSMRNLEVATQLNTQTIASFSTVGKDTTILIDSKPHPAFTFENKTEYILEKGLVIPELKQVTSEIHVEVPINGVLYWQRRKFLFLRIGKKDYNFEVTSKNPATHITQADQILIRRK